MLYFNSALLLIKDNMSKQKTQKIGIIGGGIQGLAIARLLAKKGYSVTVFEASNQLGGAVASFKIAKTQLDQLYHHLYTSDIYSIAWIKALGLSKDFVFQRARMGLLFQKKIHAFETASDLIKFKPLNIWQRFIFGLGVLRIQMIRDWQPLENITAHKWLPKIVGKAGYQIIFQPLLRSKFGSSYQQISATWFWRKINDRNSTRSGSDRQEKLGYLKGSFSRLIDAIAEDVKKHHGKILLNQPVEKIIIQKNQAKGLIAGGKEYLFDEIITTIHQDLFLKIGQNLPKDYREQLTKIKYQGAVVMVLQLKNSLSPYYWTNICDQDLPFVAIIEQTNLVPKSVYQNKNIVYLSNYLATTDRLYNLTNKKLLAEYITGLQKIFPRFKRNWIEKYFVFRDANASPIFVKNYAKLMPDYQTPVKNLYFIGLSQIYPADRGTDKSILQAENFVKNYFT